MSREIPNRGDRERSQSVPEHGLAEAVQRARTARGEPLEALLYHRAREVQEALLENPHLREQHLAVLLARRDLAREVVASIAGNKQWMKSYVLKVAVLKHPKTPRHLALPLIKFLYLIDLMMIARTPGASPELKRLAEDALLAQRAGLPLGERLTLARRGSQRIAAELLLDAEARVIRAALDNPALTEASVGTALLSERSTGNLVDVVACDPRWSLKSSVKLSLVRNRHLSLARFASILSQLTLGDLRDLAADRRVAPNLRAYVQKIVQTRSLRTHQRRV